MRHIAAFSALFVASALGGLLIATPTPKQTKLLIGDAKMSAAELIAAAKTVGKVGAVDSDGFLPVFVSNTETAKVALSKRGVDHILRAPDDEVNPGSLVSVRRFNEYQEAKNELLGIEEKDGGFYEALEFWLQRRVEEDGEIDPERWLRAARFRDNMAKWQPGGKRNFGPNGVWTNIGPFNMDTPYRTYYGVPPLSGRKTGSAVAPSNTNIIYVSGGGGIYKSTDAGTTWAHKSDGWTVLGASAVAVDPTDPNIVYAGTGDLFFGIGGFGFMRSTDGGNTWTNTGTAQFGTGIITSVKVDPSDSNVLIAVTANSNRGIYRSTDKGQNWTQVLSLGTSLLEVEASANDGSGITWWACGRGTSFQRSTDGINWTALAYPSATTESASEIACSKLNRNTVYFLSTATEAIYKTTDGGSNWSNVKNNFPNGNASIGANYNWSQKTYDYFIGCSAVGGQDIVYVGLITVAASANGGATWSDIALTYTNSAKAHNDQHSFSNHPTDPTKTLIGSDGGIWLSTHDAGTNTATFTPLNGGLSDEMFYAIALHPTDMTRVMGGTQDNATPASRGNLAIWDNLYAGDGCWCDFNRVNPGIHYTSSQGGSVYRYDSDNDPSPTGISPGWSAAFVAPLIVAGDGTELFAATTSNLQKYNGSGTSWTQSAQNVGSTVTYLAAAPSNGSVIYTGASNGQVWRTADEGVTFNRIDSSFGAIGAICVDRSNPNRVWVSHGNGNTLVRCDDTTVATPTWTAIGTGLPGVSINAIAQDPNFPNTIYVGNDVGCFYTTNGGSTWANMTTAGLPNAQISDLEINAAGTELYAGTYGRGIWKVALDQPVRTISGRITQSSAGVNGVTVNIKQGTTVVTTTTTDSNGDYTAGVLASGTYTIEPTHNDKIFFPSTKTVTVPPDATNQNFTAGNIGPVSLTFQYPVVYSDQSRQASITLNAITPVNRVVNLTDNSTKLTTPLTMTVIAGQQTGTFFVYGVTVAADTLVTVTASAQGLSVPNTITVRAKPVLNAFNLAQTTIKGGRGVSGSVTIDKPSVGTMALYLSSDNTGVSTISPTNTSYTNGVSSKSVYCRTFPVASNQLVTFTATFYGSTITKQLTVTP
ncbi:MAG: SdrD B-like domain-containing protein [Fimbriimonadaceae bacterium]